MRVLPGLFDVEDRLKRLSDLGDQLLAFAAAVDFEMFRPELARALAYSDGTQGGRPPFDPVMMFKILVIQAANNLSDERTEFLINDTRDRRLQNTGKPQNVIVVAIAREMAAFIWAIARLAQPTITPA